MPFLPPDPLRPDRSPQPEGADPPPADVTVFRGELCRGSLSLARRTALDVVCCALAIPPPRFSCRRLVFLLLVVAAAGLLARPAEAGKPPFADIVDAAARRHGVDPDLVHAVIAV